MDLGPRRQAQRKAETRAELISAARAVFVERGFHGASLQLIASLAGFTTGAIYAHFDGKDELFLAVFEDYALTRVAELVDAHDGAEADFAQRARALADQWMGRHAQGPAFTVAALEFAVHAIRAPHAREALAARHAAVRLAAARTLERDARAANLDLPMPALGLATVLRELGVGLTLAQLVDPDAVSPSLYGDFIEAFCGLIEAHERVDNPKTGADAERGRRP